MVEYCPYLIKDEKEYLQIAQQAPYTLLTFTSKGNQHSDAFESEIKSQCEQFDEGKPPIPVLKCDIKQEWCKKAAQYAHPEGKLMPLMVGVQKGAKDPYRDVFIRVAANMPERTEALTQLFGEFKKAIEQSKQENVNRSHAQHQRARAPQAPQAPRPTYNNVARRASVQSSAHHVPTQVCLTCGPAERSQSIRNFLLS